MGCFNTHASGTLDPPEVRNWRIHLIALIASMSALASKTHKWSKDRTQYSQINSGL